MARYAARLDVLEEQLGFGECGDEPCDKCVINHAIASFRGVPWAGCNGRPDAESDLCGASADEVRRMMADLEAASQ